MSKMSLSTLIRSVSIASLLGLVACSGKPDKIRLDYRFSQQEVYLIAEAQKEWIEAADSSEMDIPISLGFNSDQKPYKFREQESGSEAIFYKINTNHPEYNLLKEVHGYDPLGSTLELTGMVLVEDIIRELVEIEKIYDTYGDAFYKTILHEYGHFLGLDHLEAPTSVMASLIYVGVETCIDGGTLDYYCSINECGPNRHPTCKGGE